MTAKFVCKATSIKELRDASDSSCGNRFEIAAVVELTAREYSILSRRFLQDHEFIAAYNDIVRCENGIYHCILAKEKGAKDGVLIYSAGFDYPRYAAYYAG